MQKGLKRCICICVKSNLLIRSLITSIPIFPNIFNALILFPFLSSCRFVSVFSLIKSSSASNSPKCRILSSGISSILGPFCSVSHSEWAKNFLIKNFNFQCMFTESSCRGCTSSTVYTNIKPSHWIRFSCVSEMENVKWILDRFTSGHSMNTKLVECFVQTIISRISVQRMFVMHQQLIILHSAVFGWRMSMKTNNEHRTLNIGNRVSIVICSAYMMQCSLSHSK